MKKSTGVIRIIKDFFVWCLQSYIILKFPSEFVSQIYEEMPKYRFPWMQHIWISRSLRAHKDLGLLQTHLLNNSLPDSANKNLSTLHKDMIKEISLFLQVNQRRF